jgi:hypothetical protein
MQPHHDLTLGDPQGVVEVQDLVGLRLLLFAAIFIQEDQEVLLEISDQSCDLYLREVFTDLLAQRETPLVRDPNG